MRKQIIAIFFGLFFGFVVTQLIQCEMKRVEDLKAHTSQIKISNEAPGSYLNFAPNDDIELIHEHGFVKVTEDSILFSFETESGAIDTVIARCHFTVSDSSTIFPVPDTLKFFGKGEVRTFQEKNMVFVFCK